MFDATPTPSATSAADTLREALGNFRKPNKVTLAERHLTEARERRAIAADAERAAVHAQRQREAVPSLPSPDVLAASKALKAADQEVVRAMDALQEARQPLEKVFHEAMIRPLADVTTALVGIEGEITALGDALEDARRFAARNGVNAPRLVSDAARLRGVAATLRNLIKARR